MSDWGAADERGALNLIDAAATLRGIASVSSGTVIPLNLTIANNELGPSMSFRGTPRHFMTRDGCNCRIGDRERAGSGFSDDTLLIATHGTTHIDAIAHVWQDGRMYNDFAASTVTSRGAQHCGIDKAGPFITRALFVDFADEVMPGTAIHRDQLIAAITRTGEMPMPGDALVLRSGWMRSWHRGEAQTLESTGLHHDCADWITNSGFALVAGDNPAVEVLPSLDPNCHVPLHIALTRDHGIYLAELFDLEALAAHKRSAFLLSIAPLKIKGGVGSPITPVAVL